MIYNRPELLQNGLPRGTVLDFPFTGKAEEIALPRGRYRLECWGAQGGSYSSYAGGYGGYAVGELTLRRKTTLFIRAGGQPETVSGSRKAVPGGFNGGGDGQNRDYNSTYTYGQGGGGGSDVRIGSDDLYARVIVAGGGGGSASVSAATTKYGGGTSGGSPGSGYAGGQTGPGTGGSFGQGGSAASGGTNYKYGSGGGGGGWYGGGAYDSYTDSSSTCRGYNGGGSGYVFTADTAASYPQGCLLSSDHYLTSARTAAGNTSFPAPTGGEETGHRSDGHVRLTVL